jgi:hypothetical protein
VAFGRIDHYYDAEIARGVEQARTAAETPADCLRAGRDLSAAESDGLYAMPAADTLDS